MRDSGPAPVPERIKSRDRCAIWDPFNNKVAYRIYAPNCR